MSAKRVRLRLTVVDPPAGVEWAIQLGRYELHPPSVVKKDRFVFEVVLDVVPGKTGAPRLRGPAVQGPLGGRFLYVTSGVRAGQFDSVWNRRAKVSLEGITPEVLASSNSEELALEGEIGGVAKDGGPACASVPLLMGTWRSLARKR